MGQKSEFAANPLIIRQAASCSPWIKDIFWNKMYAPIDIWPVHSIDLLHLIEVLALRVNGTYHAKLN